MAIAKWDRFVEEAEIQKRRMHSTGISEQLPISAAMRGWRLWHEVPRAEVGDPVILIDHAGCELYRWENVPSLTEVGEVCAELEEA